MQKITLLLYHKTEAVVEVAKINRLEKRNPPIVFREQLLKNLVKDIVFEWRENL